MRKKLPKNFEIKDFTGLRNWFNSVGCPDEIECTEKQYQQYEDLFPSSQGDREVKRVLLYGGARLVQEKVSLALQ